MNEKKRQKLVVQIRLSLRKLAYFLRIKQHETTDAYTKIIPPEIFDGRFFDLIGEIADYSSVSTILEIGSSSGEGSTRALFESLAKNQKATKEIHCLEISIERFEKLKDYLSRDTRFNAHRLSSVLISDFPPFKEIEDFYLKFNSNLNFYQLDTIYSWYSKDLQYLSENPQLFPKGDDGSVMGGISWIKNNFNIDVFDFVILDGGEFCGNAEFAQVLDSKFIALDDTQSFKNWTVNSFLAASPHHRLVEANMTERNGWAIYQKI